MKIPLSSIPQLAISLMQWVFEHLNLAQGLQSPSNVQATT